MNLFKNATFWAVVETLFFGVVIYFDAVSKVTDGYWLSLVIAGGGCLFNIEDYYRYDYNLPVNHPDQRINFSQIVFNFVRSILGAGICFTPIVWGLVSGTWWIVILGVWALIICAYSIVTSFMLLQFAKDDVKFKG